MIEYKTFGFYPTVWLERFITPFFTEYFKFSYFSYYLIVFLPAFLFYKNGEKEKFDEFLLALFSAYYISFIGFIIFPVEGPRYALSALHEKPLDGYFFTSLQDFITRTGALHGGCMPSSHVAATFVTLLSLRRYQKTLYYLLLPVVLSLFFSTIYNRDHYFLDVVVGIFVGYFSFWWSTQIKRREKDAFI
ncbi:MAG: phosphatase PAP2 family protein [Thermodesulfobacteriota bacterium]|nr:phosphatase PAP2 family protein [Thermodesulfobacteriota bacterium]